MIMLTLVCLHTCVNVVVRVRIGGGMCACGRVESLAMTVDLVILNVLYPSHILLW